MHRLWLFMKGGEMMLTPKQEKFVQNVVNGMSQVDAYKNAYSAKNMSDNAIYREASLLMRNPKVSQRYKELGDMTQNEAIMSAQQRLEWLTGVIKSEEAYTSDKLRAVDIMNKMQGEYVQKIQAEVSTAININVELSDD